MVKLQQGRAFCEMDNYDEENSFVLLNFNERRYKMPKVSERVLVDFNGDGGYFFSGTIRKIDVRGPVVELDPYN